MSSKLFVRIRDQEHLEKLVLNQEEAKPDSTSGDSTTANPATRVGSIPDNSI